MKKLIALSMSVLFIIITLSACVSYAPSPSAKSYTPVPSLPDRSTLPPPSASATPMKTPTPTPAPSIKPTPTPVPTPTPTPEPTPVALSAGNTMPISALLAKLGERHVNVGAPDIVHRGNVAYFQKDNCLCLYNAGMVNVILTDADCYWMYIDSKNNLWFEMKGATGISGGKVQEWNRIYMYDLAKDSFVLKMDENGSLPVWGNGYSTPIYKNYILFFEGTTLKAYDMASGGTVNIGEADQACFDDTQKIICYGNAESSTVLLNFGEKKQTRTTVSRKNFPGKQLDCSMYILDDDNLLFEFQRIGYKLLYEMEFPDTSSSDNTPYSFVTDDGLVAVYSDKEVYADVFTIKNKTWSKLGKPYEPGSMLGYIGDGKFLFRSENAASLYIVGKNLYKKYNLPEDINSIAWATCVNGAVLLCDVEECSYATYVFLPDKQELYPINYMIPGDY